MPCIGQQGEHHGFGRPRISQSRPDRAAWICLLHDFEGRTAYELAATFEGDAFDANRKRIGRELKAGRVSFYERGILPWAVWPKGQLPERWWRQHRFHRRVIRWSQEAQLEAIRQALLASWGGR
jgi:hypothetical protein